MPFDTYASTDGSRSTNVSLSYDPTTGTWVSASPTDNKGQSTNTDSQAKEVVSKPSSTSKVDSKTAAEKEYIEAEFNTLTGELVLVSTEKTIRIQVNDTIKLEGVGKYLSGLYFVTSVRRTLNRDSGYTHSFSLVKNGFGSSLKKAQAEPETRKEEVSKTPSDFKVGEYVRIVGADATYSNASDGVKVPEWVKKKTLSIAKISSDGTRVLVQPINSWTYTKYVQKV